MTSTDRRSFLRRAAGAAAFAIVPRSVLGGPRHLAPSDELTKAVVGVGGIGRSHMRYEGARLVAVCDVDADHLARALEQAEPGVRGFRDFRELLALPDVDIVHVATPPHWHGLIAAAAVRAGKDVWCEKPMTRTIGEGTRLVELAARHRTVFRLNTWFRFKDRFYGLGTEVAPVRKLVAHGVLGWPLRVHLGAGTGFDWKLRWSGRTDLQPLPVPPTLDYDRWLGPAPVKPYHPHRVHGSFRGYWDYDAGGLGDMGQHYLDPVQYILGKDETSPVSVAAEAPQQHPDAVGSWRRIRLRYADGCEIVLDATGRDQGRPFIEGPAGKVYRGLGSTIRDLRQIADELPDPEPQITDFGEAVRTRRRFALNERNGHRSCTLVNLAAIAVRLRRPLAFDPATQRFVGDAEADRMIDPPMRAPWNL